MINYDELPALWLLDFNYDKQDQDYKYFLYRFTSYTEGKFFWKTTRLGWRLQETFDAKSKDSAIAYAWSVHTEYMKEISSDDE